MSKKIYKAFAKTISNLSYSDHLHHLELGLLSLESTHIEADLITTYKIVHNVIGVSLNDVRRTN